MDQGIRIGGGQYLGIRIERLQGAVTAHEGRCADSQMDVGSARFDAYAQEIIDAQPGGESIGVRRRLRGLDDMIDMDGGTLHGGSGLRLGDGLAQTLGLLWRNDGLFV